MNENRRQWIRACVSGSGSVLICEGYLFCESYASARSSMWITGGMSGCPVPAAGPALCFGLHSVVRHPYLAHGNFDHGNANLQMTSTPLWQIAVDNQSLSLVGAPATSRR